MVPEPDGPADGPGEAVSQDVTTDASPETDSRETPPEGDHAPVQNTAPYTASQEA